MLVLKFLAALFGLASVRSNSVGPENVENHPNFYLLPQDDCGVVTHTYRRIIHGTEATDGEFPWIAFLSVDMGNGIIQLCGGSVINPHYILTAQHCIVKNKTHSIKLGVYDWTESRNCSDTTCKNPVYTYLATDEDITLHKNYNHVTFPNDIALIRLKTPIDFKATKIRPICLPTNHLNQDNLSEESGVIAGWGDTEKGETPSVLRRANVIIRTVDDCKRKADETDDTSVPFSKVCTKSKDGEACNGDSGGPLMKLHKIGTTERYFQEGIVSFGDTDCLKNGGETVYTNLRRYMTWILDNIKA